MSSGNFKHELFAQFARVGKALSNANRLELLEFLAQGERSVEALANVAGLTVANTSQHLAVLRQAGVVNTRKDGINVYYSLRSQKITEACYLTRDILVERLQDQLNLSNLITDQD